MSQRELVISGTLQGMGIGLLFVPATTMAFTTLPPNLRNEGSAAFSLSRNLGSSVGVSIVMSTLSRYLWINQQQLSAHPQMTPEMVAALPPTSELIAIPAEVLRELGRGAAEIAFANVFQLLMWITLAATPLVLLLADLDRTEATTTPARLGRGSKRDVLGGSITSLFQF
ncbi:MAG: hypothetical protein OSA77_02145 [Halioglobus sp.]|nr:hypothetical protein [Halioglobus sp.]